MCNGTNTRPGALYQGAPLKQSPTQLAASMPTMPQSLPAYQPTLSAPGLMQPGASMGFTDGGFRGAKTMEQIQAESWGGGMSLEDRQAGWRKQNPWSR